MSRRTPMIPRLSLQCSLAAILVVSAFAAADERNLFLVPWPKSVRVDEGELMLNGQSRIVAADPRLAPLAGVLSDEIWRAASVRLPVATGPAGPGDISLVWQ